MRGFLYVILDSMCLLRCVHLLPKSVLLLMFFVLLMFLMMWNFSDVHRSHVFCDGLYCEHVFSICHLMVGVGWRLFSQIYWDRAVLFFLVSDLKLCVWLLYLVLNSFSVEPMYSACAVDALYTTQGVRHLLGMGHFSLSLQLHGRIGSFSLVELIR